MLPIKISKKIVSYKIAAKESTTVPNVPAQVMCDDLARPELLLGSTYKIKTPQSEHALYITINDMILNQDTIHEERRPYEVFINSKNMDYFQWVLALTRVISAVLRKGGDCTFLVAEMKAVFDPKGGYFKKSTFMPSVVHEIGCCLEEHLKALGMIKDLDSVQKEFISAKRKEFEEVHGSTGDSFPRSAILCSKCTTKAVIILDGCATCLSCGDSKCG